MFNIKRKQEEPSPVDGLIEELISEMKGLDGYSDEYPKSAASLKALFEVKAAETKQKPEGLNVNTIAAVAGNLVGIVLILAFEKSNVITSKGLGFVMKPRI